MPGLLIIAKILSDSLISLSSIVYFQPCLRWQSKKRNQNKSQMPRKISLSDLGETDSLMPAKNPKSKHLSPTLQLLHLSIDDPKDGILGKGHKLTNKTISLGKKGVDVGESSNWKIGETPKILEAARTFMVQPPCINKMFSML